MVIDSIMTKSFSFIYFLTKSNDAIAPKNVNTHMNIVRIMSAKFVKFGTIGVINLNFVITAS